MDKLLPYLTALLRSGLLLLAGWLVARGYLDADKSGGFVDQALAFALAVAPIAWSFYQKSRTAAHLQQAADQRAGSTPPKVPL
jgi:hypothetical protein